MVRHIGNISVYRRFCSVPRLKSKAGKVLLMVWYYLANQNHCQDQGSTTDVTSMEFLLSCFFEEHSACCKRAYVYPEGYCYMNSHWCTPPLPASSPFSPSPQPLFYFWLIAIIRLVLLGIIQGSPSSLWPVVVFFWLLTCPQSFSVVESRASPRQERLGTS